MEFAKDTRDHPLNEKHNINFQIENLKDRIYFCGDQKIIVQYVPLSTLIDGFKYFDWYKVSSTMPTSRCQSESIIKDNQFQFN